MIQQGKTVKAKRNFNAIVNHGKSKKQILEAKKILQNLNQKEDQK
jgi:hypothetical protein